MTDNTNLQSFEILCFAASSSEIHDALKDENLQKLICDIDSSLDPENVSNITCFFNREKVVLFFLFF